MEELNREAERYLPLLFKEAVHKAHTTVVQPIYDVDSTKMVFGRVTLIGDAAFVARPHVGIGVLKAAQDAHSLAVHLRTHASIDRALALFEADRLSASKKAVQHGRLLGSFIEQGLTLPENDPDLDLTRERLIRVSGRPYEHIAEFSLW